MLDSKSNAEVVADVLNDLIRENKLGPKEVVIAVLSSGLDFVLTSFDVDRRGIDRLDYPILYNIVIVALHENLQSNNIYNSKTFLERMVTWIGEKGLDDILEEAKKQPGWEPYELKQARAVHENLHKLALKVLVDDLCVGIRDHEKKAMKAEVLFRDLQTYGRMLDSIDYYYGIKGPVMQEYNEILEDAQVEKRFICGEPTKLSKKLHDEIDLIFSYNEQLKKTGKKGKKKKTIKE